ncbi:MAG: CRISPR-associated endonuclease Cas6 [Bacteroidota bacterium]
MPFIRVVKISFNTPLRDSEIPAFRGAIVHLVGRDQVAFHNHLSGDKYAYGYPLIQYQSSQNRAEIVSIHQGTEDIHHLFSKNNGEIRIGETRRPLMVEHVKINRFNLHVNGSFYHYQIKDWLPFNEKNYREYQHLEDLAQKIQFLEKILIGNILSFAKGVQWMIQEKIELQLSDLPIAKKKRRKGQLLMAFDIKFKTNVLLPSDIGLGKSVSVGYGTVIKL